MDTWVGLSILIPCVGWILIGLLVLALVAIRKNRSQSPRPKARPRPPSEPSSSHPILRGFGLFVLLVLAIVGLWIVAFIVYMAAERRGGPPEDAVGVALVGVAMFVGCGVGFLWLSRRPDRMDQPHEPALGYRLLVVGWVVGLLLTVGIPITAFLTGKTNRMENLIFSVVGSCSAPILVVLVLATVGRLVWMNRKRWAESLSYANPVPSRPQPVLPSDPPLPVAHPPQPIVLKPPAPVAKRRNPGVVILGSFSLVAFILGLGWIGTSALTYGVPEESLSPTGWFVGGVSAGMAVIAAIGLFMLVRSQLVPSVTPQSSAGVPQSTETPAPRSRRWIAHAIGSALLVGGMVMFLSAKLQDDSSISDGRFALLVVLTALALILNLAGAYVAWRFPAPKPTPFKLPDSPARKRLKRMWTALSEAWEHRHELASDAARRLKEAESHANEAINLTPQPRACPKCQTPITSGAPEGLCPRCLIQHAFPSPNLSPTTAYGGFTPPTVEEVTEFFPHLEIHGLIGQGGMGAVYLATQKALDRPVALKIIRIREDDPTFEERFVREAKAMARLSHPNIVAIYDHGTAGGLPYLVLEYVDGVTLRDAMRAKRLTPAEALKIIPQVCDALEYAHSQGVVHRDVKPENILLDRSGKVKIADFGLAKVADPNGISLTHTRQTMGTPHYMAPEQWEKPSEVDHRADIYALGVVLYELLTGELPLGRFDPPSVKAAVDARIDDLILRALAKEPGRRFQHATDVKLALAAITTGRFQSVYGHEYKSKQTFLGLPLVHIVRGRDPLTGRRKAAKGWLAIGEGSAFGGIAIGGTTAVGGVAIAGVVSVGGIAISGAGAMGIFALAGGWAVGGLFAASGALAAAGGLAVAGALALGKFAIAGAVADGSHRFSGSRQDADFGQRLQEWVETIWTDYLWPF